MIGKYLSYLKKMENKIRLKNIQLCCWYGIKNQEKKADQQFVIDIGVFIIVI